MRLVNHLSKIDINSLLGFLNNRTVEILKHLGYLEKITSSKISKIIIKSYSEEKISMEEGCLTFPLLFLNITRPATVDVRYYKNDGIIIEDTFHGMDARCFQHEYEHLQGAIYLDHASELKLRRAFDKREKLFKKLERSFK